MSNYFFFDPGMTDIDTVIFGPDEMAVQVVSNASKTWCITANPDIDGINDVLHAFFNESPKATVFSVQVYSEAEFRDMWGYDNENW